MYDDIKLNQDNYGSGSFRAFVGFAFALVGEYFFNCWTPNVQQNDMYLLIQKGLEVIPQLPSFGSLCLLFIRTFFYVLLWRNFIVVLSG